MFKVASFESVCTHHVTKTLELPAMPNVPNWRGSMYMKLIIRLVSTLVELFAALLLCLYVVSLGRNLSLYEDEQSILQR